MNHSFDNQTSDFGKTGLEFKNQKWISDCASRPNLALAQKSIEATFRVSSAKE
ncbi:hypothetical protein L2726_000984 [Vibrio parahaemolyticus]|nr:hypothetical protein [Vibrio parahaemolyticus]EIT7128524.1 hypothetical protein [Vibrio parahaemolyticus]EIZ4249143.1 hypothetical protein [Vibrio parahaemolyticus]